MTANLHPIFKHALAQFMPAQPQPIECAEVGAVFNMLARRMQASGFSEMDLRILFDARDVICGEQEYSDALDGMNDIVNSLGLTSRIETARLVGLAEKDAK